MLKDWYLSVLVLLIRAVTIRTLFRSNDSLFYRGIPSRGRIRSTIYLSALLLCVIELPNVAFGGASVIAYLLFRVE